MGSDLPPGKKEQSPTFLVSAARDPGTRARPGTLLQRAQIVKAWVGPDGEFQQAIYDVAGNPESEASVDLETCETSGEGATQLCGVWKDPDFDPTTAAVYYSCSFP